MEAFSIEQREYLKQRFGQVMAAMARQPPSDQSPAAPDGPSQPHGDNGSNPSQSAQQSTTRPPVTQPPLILPIFVQPCTASTLDVAQATLLEDTQCPSAPVQPGHVGQLGADPAAWFPPKLISKSRIWNPQAPRSLAAGVRYTGVGRVLHGNGSGAVPQVPGKSPGAVCVFMADLPCARIYDSHAWVTYDRIYRHQATTRRSLDWSVEDQLLDNEVFAEQARQSTRCKHCLGENHTVKVCPEMPLAQLPVSLVPATPVSLSGPVPNRPSLTQQPNAQSGEVCRGSVLL
ncbi:hypothetical protein EMCRGX_G008488 [Ephydatia muelleri]